MIKINNKFAIGCLVQWYEIDIIEEYVNSVKQSLSQLENPENVIVHFTLTTNQELERIDETQIDMKTIEKKFESMMSDKWRFRITSELVTIADYRRWFNDYYCEKVDVLMWGETDSLIPTQTFEILDGLHSQVKNQTPKYVSFFSTCKMWDESWKVIEHPDFTDKPFIEGDTENWWSLRYTMNQQEMDEINSRTTNLDVQAINPYKFNGCGLVISSEVIKSGVNIPKSVFFIHEDTAFMHMMQRILGESVPQYLIKNILLVHNRKHPGKRMYIDGEQGIDKTDPGAQRGVHEWYKKANKMCEHNAYNLFNQTQTFTWDDVFDNTGEN